MKKQSLVSRIMSLISGGDEGKLTRFEGKLSKYLAKQIQMRKDAIETLNEKIVDAKEALNDVVLGVDVDKVNTTDGAESYCSQYVSSVSSKIDTIEAFEAQIKSFEEEITRFNKIQAAIYSVEEKQ